MSAQRLFRATIMHMTVALAMVALVVVTPACLLAQSATERIAAGDKESAAGRSAQALQQYDGALHLEPRNYPALWKAAREAVDLGEIESDAAKRSAFYVRATAYARRAIAVDSTDAEAYFHAARALGRAALTMGARDKVKLAAEIRHDAMRALQLQPRHPGAAHVMGVWNAEIMRLNGVTRLIARTFLGGQVFSTASWPEATRYMELAVAIEPDRLVHRLDLARVYRDSGRLADARRTYEVAIGLPSLDANDAGFRREAQDELKALR